MQTYTKNGVQASLAQAVRGQLEASAPEGTIDALTKIRFTRFT